MPNNCNESHANLLNTDKLRERLLKSRMHRKVWSCLSQGVCWDFEVEQFISGNRSLPYLVGFTLSGRSLQSAHPRTLWADISTDLVLEKCSPFSERNKKKTSLEALRVFWDETWHVQNVIICILLSFLVASVSHMKFQVHVCSWRRKALWFWWNHITWYMPIGWYSGTSTEGSGVKTCPTTHSNVFSYNNVCQKRHFKTLRTQSVSVLIDPLMSPMFHCIFLNKQNDSLHLPHCSSAGRVDKASKTRRILPKRQLTKTAVMQSCIKISVLND